MYYGIDAFVLIFTTILFVIIPGIVCVFGFKCWQGRFWITANLTAVTLSAYVYGLWSFAHFQH